MKSAKAIRFGALALEPGGGGVSTYARELLHAITHAMPTTVALSATVQSAAAADLPHGVTAIKKPTSRGVTRALQAKIPCSGADVFHSLDVDLPISGSAVTVATVHDLSVFDVPWAFSKIRARGEQVLVRDALRRADVLIAVSDFTAQRIMDLTGRESVVTPLAPASWTHRPSPESVEAVRSKYSLPARFILQVGTIEPRKRPHVVAEAARRLGIPSVLAGKGTDSNKLPSGAIGLGYVPVDDLPALYGAATMVAYASVYEGFGLPPVEAMACGAAVVASRVGALPDVVADGAILVPTHEVEDWTAAMRPWVSDAGARSELMSLGLRAAAALSWSRTANLTIQCYRTAGVTA